MISQDFVKFWAPQFDTQKFPIDFYQHYINSARNIRKPEQLKEDLRALLHWKDRKAGVFEPEKNHAKPNTLNPIIRLKDKELKDFAQSFWELVEAGGKDVVAIAESFQSKLSEMWKSVVIPAFLLHVAKPERLPIIDQHTVRAFLALTSGRIVKNPKITWLLWKKYVSFFKMRSWHQVIILILKNGVLSIMLYLHGANR